MQISNSNYSLALVWVAVAASSIVFVEPAPTDLISIFALCLFFALGMRTPPGFSPAVVLLGVYLIANVAACMLAPDPAETWRSVSIRFYMAIYFLLFSCLIYENPDKVLRLIWSAYLVATVITITSAIIGYYRLAGSNEAIYTQLLEYGRARALFKDPNVYGPFIVPMAMFAIAKIATASRRQTPIYVLLLGYCGIGILLGFSRGSWLNFATSLVLYFVLRLVTLQSLKERRRILLTAVSLISAGIILVGAAASTEKIQDMMKKRLRVVQYYDVGEGGRLTRQLEIAEAIAVTPQGIGAGQAEKDHYFKHAPHNLYLHVLIEAGWIGGFAFIAFILLTVWRGGRFILRARNINGVHIATYSCLIGILVQSLFIDSTHWRHFFLIFAMIWGPTLAWENEVKTSWSRLRASSGLAGTVAP